MNDEFVDCANLSFNAKCFVYKEKVRKFSFMKAQK